MKKHVSNWLSHVLNVDVAIKSYAISSLTGSTFDGFIDCTLEICGPRGLEPHQELTEFYLPFLHKLFCICFWFFIIYCAEI